MTYHSNFLIGEISKGTAHGLEEEKSGDKIFALGELLETVVNNHVGFAVRTTQIIE